MRAVAGPRQRNSSVPATVELAVGSGGKQPTTFRQFYNDHNTGRGLNKWSNALDAYQRHLSGFAGQYIAIGEIGIQSGGSIDMWQATLGPACQVFGIDINPQVTQFQNAMTTVVIGDQADMSMWENFFSAVVKGPLNILVDDGGHEANQMLTTLMQSFDHMTPNGVIAIEDIHGPGYLNPFFIPAAHFLGYKAAKGQLASVDIYPFLLITQREGALPLQFVGPYGVVDSIEAIWTEAPKYPGGYLILENAAWGSFHTPSAFTNFFTVFNALHASNWYSMPPGCEHTSAAVCSVTVTPNAGQALITGVHIYPKRLIVEVASGPVTIQAVRKGSSWLPY